MFLEECGSGRHADVRRVFVEVPANATYFASLGQKARFEQIDFPLNLAHGLVADLLLTVQLQNGFAFHPGEFPPKAWFRQRQKVAGLFGIVVARLQAQLFT